MKRVLAVIVCSIAALWIIGAIGMESPPAKPTTSQTEPPPSPETRKTLEKAYGSMENFYAQKAALERQTASRKRHNEICTELRNKKLSDLTTNDLDMLALCR
jgi:cell division septation protein DedD